MSADRGPVLYFQMLSREEQHIAIHKMADSGLSDHTIAAATRLSVEMVRVILGQPKTEPKL